MAIHYVTGRDLSLTINSVTYNDVAESVTMNLDTNTEILQVIGGEAPIELPRTGTLEVELIQDWGSTSPASVCEALWDAANSAPTTALTFSFDANGSTFAGSVYPTYPSAGGSATEVAKASLSFVIVEGTVTRS